MASTTLFMTPYWLSITIVVFLPNQVKAADFGHMDVDERDVVVRSMTSGEDLLAITGCIHAIAGGFKDHFQIAADIALVIGD